MLDPLLYGRGRVERITRVEPGPRGTVTLYLRLPYATATLKDGFEPWMLLANPDLLQDVPERGSVHRLRGEGWNLIVRFKTWRDFWKAVSRLEGRKKGKKDKKSRKKQEPNPAPGLRPYYSSSLITQYLLMSGNTPFKGLEMDDLNILAVDIEVYVPEGYEFPNKSREDHRIILVSMADNRGWKRVVGGPEMSEKEILEETVKLIRQRDPDILAGHNVFDFDIPWLVARCKRHGVKFGIGRDGSEPRFFQTVYKVGERIKTFTSCEVYGRTVIDTLHLVQRWDAIKRELPSYALKEVIRHLGLESGERTFIDGSMISRVWEKDPEQVIRYALDDAEDVIKLIQMLLPSEFYQDLILPVNFQQSLAMGPAGKWELLMVREHLARGLAVPFPDPKQEYEGGYTEVFWQGVLPGGEARGRGIAKLDFDSLYPSIMRTHELNPKKDTEGIFLGQLTGLTEQRLAAKTKARELKEAGKTEEYSRYDALQSAFKIFINGAYGYLGYPRASFNDYAKAAEVTRVGRELAKNLVKEIRARGGIPIEVDTDGVFFVVPDEWGSLDKLVDEINRGMPEGISVSLDGEWKAMCSLAAKSYVLFGRDGKLTVKGAALKSRGLEAFGTAFLKEGLRLLLEGDVPGLRSIYLRTRRRILEHELDIREFARTETLRLSLDKYKEEIERKKPRRAVYELLSMHKGEPKYRQGDRISYYNCGTRASDSDVGHSKLAIHWDSTRPDYNVPKLLKRLREFAERFRAAFAPEDFEQVFLDDLATIFADEETIEKEVALIRPVARRVEAAERRPGPEKEETDDG